MPQNIHPSFNGLATTGQFSVADVLKKLSDNRAYEISILKDRLCDFEEGPIQNGAGAVRRYEYASRLIQEGFDRIHSSLARLENTHKAIDVLVGLGSEVKMLELDSTNNLADEVIKAARKQALKRVDDRKVTHSASL